MTSGGTDEIEIEIEIEIFRLGAMERQYGTDCVISNSGRSCGIEMFASSVNPYRGTQCISYFALVIIPYNAR
jgi:hypothetical protein